MTLTLAALSGIALLVPALTQLRSETVPVQSMSFIGFALSGETVGGEVGTRINDLDPANSAADVRVFVEINVDAKSDDDETSDGGSTPDRGGSIVLGGPIADGLISCDDEAFVITKDLTWDELLAEEQRAVLEQFERSLSGVGTGAEGTAGGSDALTRSDDSVYTTIRPDTWFSYESDWTLTSDNDETRNLRGVFNYTTCTFTQNAFWSQQGFRQAFIYPAHVAVAGRTDGEASVLEAHWRLRVVPSAFDSLVRSDLSGAALASGGQDFVQDAESWVEERPAIALRDSVLVFADQVAKQQRDVWIFIAGIGVSILGGLVASLIARLAGGPAEERASH